MRKQNFFLHKILIVLATPIKKLLFALQYAVGAFINHPIAIAIAIAIARDHFI